MKEEQNEWRKFSECKPKEGDSIWCFMGSNIFHRTHYDPHVDHFDYWKPSPKPQPPAPEKSPAEIWVDENAYSMAVTSVVRNALIGAFNAGRASK